MSNQKNNSIQMDLVLNAKEKLVKLLNDNPKFIGVGLTRIDNKHGFIVYTSDNPAIELNIPDEIDGFKIKIDVIGKMKI